MARYYNPVNGRFLSEDPARDGYNWYVYCDNNPLIYVDPNGEFWETLLDVVSLGFSIYDVVSDPTDIWAWAGLAGDIIDFIPFVTGVGEGIKAIGASNKIVVATNAADTVVDSLKTLKVADRVKAIKDGAVIMPYKELRKLTKNTGLEAHHLIEKRFASALGMKSDEILSIAIDSDTHKTITKAFRDRIPYRAKNESMEITKMRNDAQSIWNAVRDVYIEKDMTEYLDLLKKEFIKAGHNLNWGNW